MNQSCNTLSVHTTNCLTVSSKSLPLSYATAVLFLGAMDLCNMDLYTVAALWTWEVGLRIRRVWGWGGSARGVEGLPQWLYLPDTNLPLKGGERLVKEQH